MVLKYKIDSSFLEEHDEDDDLTITFNPKTASDADFKSFMTWCYLERKKSDVYLNNRIDVLEHNLQDVETALGAKDGEINDLNDKNTALEQRVIHLETQVKTLLEQLMPEIDNRVLELERYTRGFNLRFYNFPEEINNHRKEDCKAKLLNKLTSVGLPNVKIENAHRVGPYDPHAKGPRGIIAWFHERPEKKQVLAKRTQLYAAGCPVFDDLCKKDLIAKAQHADAMKAIWSPTNRTYFSRGRWYVNGRPYTPVPAAVPDTPVAAEDTRTV